MGQRSEEGIGIRVGGYLASLPVRLLGGLIYLSLTRNSGAAFSMASGHTWIFPLVTVVVVAWIVWMATRLRSLPWAVALGLVLGGALGNFIDRIRLGAVIDFVDMGIGDWRWYTFNVADSAISIALVILIGLSLFGERLNRRIAQPQSL